MPLDVGRVTHLLEQMHRSEDDAGDPIVVGKTLVTDGARGFTWEDAGGTGTDLGWFNVEDYGAVHDGTTDDTPAIQDAIDACMTAGGGTVWFPAGIYQISGALQDTSGYNAQLTIPQVAVTSSTPPRPIRFLGAGPVTPTSGYGAPINGTVLRSDWNGSISGHPAIFSAGEWGDLPGDPDENGVQVRFEEIGIQFHDNPKLSALQFQAAKSLSCHRVLLQPTANAGSFSLPTNTNAVGIDMPLGLASQFPDSLYDVAVEGIYTGIVASEQACGDDIGFYKCAQAISFVGHETSPHHTRHANHFGKVLASWCPRVLVFTADLRWVYIDMLNIEHDNSPFAPVADIDDASNLARGFIGYHCTEFTTGPEDIILNGAGGLSLHSGHIKRWRLNNVVDIPTGTNPSSNPTNGRRLYADSSSGNLIGRNSSGTLYDYEKMGGTVALTGTPSAGQVPVATSSSAATWQTPSGALENAVAGILVSDTPAGSPLVFDDLLQNSDGTDLLYEPAT